MASPAQGSVSRERFFPWIVGAIAFLFYCLTLNHWASLSNIGAIARVSEWTWQPELRQPLTCALLFPFRLLPTPWLPFALNLFAAACAALVLTLLARSVLLLGEVGRAVLTTPRFAVWAPALLAVTVCGLQLTFWEHATAFSGEMIDLLIFACVIRCLLEYTSRNADIPVGKFKNDDRESWLFRSAFIYSAGMTNNWAMIGYFPLYVVAVLFVKNFGFKRVTKPPPPRQPRRLPRWLRDLLAKIGIRQNAMAKPVYAPFRPVVFDTTFFARMALWGLAGLSFYLLLPIIQSLSSNSEIGFWPALKANLSFQKNLLGALRSPSFRLLAIASLLPALVLVMGWRAKSRQSGYETRRAIFFNRIAAYPLHALIFVLALWLSFDPAFSPRRLGLGIPMLSYYYLSAIVAGYCAGYFLRIACSAERARPRAQQYPPVQAHQNVLQPSGKWLAVPGDGRAPPTVPRCSTFISTAFCILAAALPLLLILRNLRQIRLTNGPSLHQFAREMYADLSDGKSVVLGNDFAQLSLLRAELAAQHHAKDALVVELPSLSSAQYHVFMARQFGSRWPVVPPTNQVDLVGPIKLLKLISAFAEHEPVAYLDPNFGPLFDRPVDSLTGFIHHFATVGRASPRADPETTVALNRLAGTLAPPSNEPVWQQRWTNHIQQLAAWFKTYSNPQRLRRLQTEPNATAYFLGATYSKSLNTWGVHLQRAEQWTEAAEWFRRSIDLNPQNLCARINLEFNTQWQRGEKTRLNPSAIQKQYAEILARHNDWRDVLSEFGPVDEPTFLYRTGRAFLANGNPRLAANAFQRSSELAPDWPQPILWQAQSLLEQGHFARALEVSEHISNLDPSRDGPGLAQLLDCRTTSLQGLGRTNEIAPCIDAFVRDHGEHPDVLTAAADAYAQNGMHEQQLAMIEELLKREPNRPEWLSQKGVAELQLGRYDAAIATLSTVLALAPTDDNARLSRAVARLGAEQLDAARDDYQHLLNSRTCSANALFGLGAVAWRKHDTNAGITFYQQYLTNAFPGSPQFIVATERLRQLKAH